jgi:hypothetical protein
MAGVKILAMKTMMVGITGEDKSRLGPSANLCIHATKLSAVAGL